MEFQGIPPKTMQKSSGLVLAPPPRSRKASARVALVDIKEPARSLLADCFKQFGIEAVVMTGDVPERLQREKLEACVVHLTPDAVPVMESARTSASNNRMVIYGLGGSAQEAMKFSRYGVNAVFHEPLERQAALKLVRATQMLVLHEFRRYIRIPIITEISMVSADSRRFTATSQETQHGRDVGQKPRGCPGRHGAGSFVRLADSAPHLGARHGQLAQARQELWRPLRRQG